MKILMVEDDPEIRNAYTFALAKHGYEVLQAGDAEHALEMMQQHMPSLMLLDMLMPGVSGVQFLRENEIKKNFPQTIIVAFSNVDSQSVIDQAKELGAAEYLIKVEITPDEVVGIVEKLVGPPTRS